MRRSLRVWIAPVVMLAPVAVERCRTVDPELHHAAGAAAEHRAACILV